MTGPVVAARALMGMSLGFHICFTAIGIGLPLFFFIAEGLALRTGNESYRLMAKRWARIAAVLFAVGAVSGTILSFEFGLLWPTWMAFSGGIIGIAFSMEGFAFFLEAIFVGIYLYGWDRLSPRAHWLSTIPIVVGSAASAVFVISANAWMNHPVGFQLVNGKPVNIDPLKATLLNSAAPLEILHGAIASYVATAFAIAAYYALRMFRGHRNQYVKQAITLAMAVGLVSVVFQGVTGDLSGNEVAHIQPEKYAAMEAQFQTENGAPLHILGIPDPAAGVTRFAIEIPHLASLLAFHSYNAQVKGLDSFPPNDRPNVYLVHFSFQVMVGIGFLLLFLTLWFWWTVWRRRSVELGRWLLRALIVSGPLGFLAIETGWFTTEFGRQPWIIYHIMRTSQGATTRGGIGVLLGVFAVVYFSMTVALALLLLREQRRSLASAESARSTEEQSHGA